MSALSGSFRLLVEQAAAIKPRSSFDDI